MKIFKEDGIKPSNLLAKYLFKCEKNELTDILPIKHEKFKEQIEKINTHIDHDKLLIEALDNAKDKVCIT
jgi:hypothetical protein